MAVPRTTILLVEDEAINAMAVIMELNAEGYDVTHVLTGEAAVDAVATSTDYFGLILMDIDLGRGIDGTEAARRILAVAEIPIVFLSSHTEREIVARTESISSYGYVVKNSGITVLDASIKMAIKLFEARKREREKDRALRTSEERFHALFERAPLGYQSLDAEGRFVDVNEAWVETLGYTREEIIGTWFGDLLLPEHQPVFQQRFHFFKTAGQIHTEFEMIHKNGSHRLVEFEGRVGYDEHGRFKQTHCILSDITELREAMLAEAASQERLRAVFNLSSVGMAVSGMDGHWSETNRAFRELIGYSATELENLTNADITLPEDWPASRDGLSDLIAGRNQGYRIEKRYVRKDGSIIWADVSVSPMRDSSGTITGAVGAVVDITSKKEAEEKLATRERMFRTLAESSQDYIMLYDRQCRHLYMNPAAIEASERSMSELIGKTHREAGFDSVMCDTWEAKIGRVVETGEPTQQLFEYVGVHSSVYLDLRFWPIPGKDGKVEQVLAVSRDVTDLRRAGEVERRLTERLNLATAAGAIGIWDWDIARNELVWDDRMHELYGVPRDRFGGVYEAWLACIHPDDRESCNAAVDRIVESGNNYQSEFRVLSTDGNMKFFKSYGVVQRNKEGRAVRITGISCDITDRKETEEKLRLLVAQKDVMMRELQHRIKNNLTVVASLIGIGKDSLGPGHADKILRDTMDRISAISSAYDKLNLSDDLVSVDLRSYFADLIATIVRTYAVEGRDIRVKTELADFRLDSRLAMPLGLILNELITNALKYAYADRKNGELRVTLSNSETDLVGGIRLRVEDDGPGFPPEFVPDSSFGMGYRLVHLLAEQIGGTLTVASGPGARIQLDISE